MANVNCPWCEAELPLSLEVEADEQTCAECLTTWSYESAAEIALAA